jgi:hypothetical protein
MSCCSVVVYERNVVWLGHMYAAVAAPNGDGTPTNPIQAVRVDGCGRM